MKLGVAGSMCYKEGEVGDGGAQVGQSAPATYLDVSLSFPVIPHPPLYVVDNHNRPFPYHNDSGVWSTCPLRPTYVAKGEQV